MRVEWVCSKHIIVSYVVVLSEVPCMCVVTIMVRFDNLQYVNTLHSGRSPGKQSLD